MEPNYLAQTWSEYHRRNQRDLSWFKGIFNIEVCKKEPGVYCDCSVCQDHQ